MISTLNLAFASKAGRTHRMTDMTDYMYLISGKAVKKVKEDHPSHYLVKLHGKYGGTNGMSAGKVYRKG